MTETTILDVCAQLIVAESRAAEKGLQARLAQEFFRAMLGLDLNVEQSYATWQGIARRWEEAKSQKGLSVPFRQVLVNYLLESPLLSDPIVTEFSELQRLRFSSTTDHLTGIHNRRYFDALLTKEVQRAIATAMT